MLSQTHSSTQPLNGGIVLRYGAVPVSKEGHLRQHRFDGSVAPLKEQSRIVQRAQDVHELAQTRLKIWFQ